MNLINRLKLAAKIILRGAPSEGARSPVPPISPEDVYEAKRFFPLDKFFIFGHARSGTTLLMRLINAHPQVLCNRQAHFFTRPPLLESLVADPEVAAWLKRGSVRWNRGGDLSPVVLRAVADYILERDASKEGASIVGDKSPSNLLNGEAVRLMHKVYPDAKLIFIVRDGRDAVLSHRFQAFIDATQHLKKADLRIMRAFAKDPEQFRNPKKSLFTEELIRSYAEGWVKNLEETQAIGRRLYGKQYLDIRYEDLLTHPINEVTRIWSFLEADLDKKGLKEAVLDIFGDNRDARWQQQKAGDMANAIPKGQAGGWQDYFSARDRAIFKQIAGDMLIKWGYENNLDW